MMTRNTRLAGTSLLLLFILLLWLYPLLSLRLAHAHDFPVHLRWADQFLSALRDGWLLPRWASASLSGLGDPTFFYYQPLFYYITSIFSVLGLRSEYALVWAATVPYLLLGWIVYYHMLEDYHNRNAVLATIFVLGCPVLYFLSTHYAGLPWSLSLPFSVLFVAESTREQPRPLRLAVLLSLICLSHLLSGLITLSCSGLGRLVFAFPTRRTIATHIKWGLGVILGLGLASFFIYPAISQLHLINPSGWTDGVNFDWRRAFILPLVGHFKYGDRWFSIQWPFALLALLMCVMVLMRRPLGTPTPAQVFARRLALVGLSGLVLGSELAYPLYALVSPMQKLQFPYRFVFLATLLANIAFVIHLNENAWRRWGKLAKSAAVLLVVAQCTQTGYMQWNLYRTGEKLPDRASFMTGNFGQPEYLPAVSGPRWKEYVADGKLGGECRQLSIGCNEINHRTHDFSVVIDTPRTVFVRLPVFAFPAWRVSVDGLAQASTADIDTGLVLVELPPGRHKVAMSWSRLPAEIIGLWISTGALVVLLGALAILRLRQCHGAVQPVGSTPVQAAMPA